MNLSRYAKTVAAVVGTIATWGATASADGTITQVEWWGLLAALAAVVGVYGVPNRPPAGEPSDPAMSEQDLAG